MLVVASALVLAGCGSTSAASGPSGNAASAVPAAVTEAVTSASQPIDTFVAPGPAIDTSKITGGKVYVIVPALEVQDFSVVANEIKTRRATGRSAGSPSGS
ncbi:hypothetical protein [Actinoplanes subtropicus]|uniref:hypothetical protein n=1 Tax=Actinoplanes subtropicus TaxID=543632 RepID=UPI0004C3E444|nr:hypothetical protein [Actinoplanes subtropicus]